jgi:hypothetical protein
VRVMVTGSRAVQDDATNRVHVSMALRFVVDGKEGPHVLIDGGARGIDRIAASIASRLGWEVETIRADWSRLGKAAGPLRNQRLVDSGPDVCVAFPTSLSRGTWDAVRRAHAASVPVVNGWTLGKIEADQ